MLKSDVRPSLVALAVGLIMLVGAAAAAAAEPLEAGSVRFAKAAESSFDAYTRNPTDVQKAWMRSHYVRMRVYAPYFDTRLSWSPDAWAYQDLYAIYRTSPLATEHPEWILKDAAGNRLYIPFGCADGSCPQYAADFGNPAFRSWWIQSAAAKMAKGYRGLFIDDVNMEFRVGNGTGAFVAPQDPRTGAAMTEANWRRYMAEFTEQIREALPGKEIVHNAVWHAGCGSTAYSCWSDPHIRRELLAADYIELERGVNDARITGGGGRLGYETFMARIDWLHSQGKAVVFDARASTTAGREYGLASYFLVSTGRDLLGNDPGGTPDDWWTGYDVQLGAPKSSRYSWNGLLRRDFENGYALVNQPGATSKTVSLGGTYTDMAGLQTTSVALGPASGAVLLGAVVSEPGPPLAPELTPPLSVEKATGKLATASSASKRNFGAAKVVDGDSGTRWSSAYKDNEWWQVDLGRTRPVDAVELNWERAYASKYRIMTSTDGINFSVAAEVTNSSAGLNRTSFAVRDARYVRILGVTRATTKSGISFWDARVYGPAD